MRRHFGLMLMGAALAALPCAAQNKPDPGPPPCKVEPDPVPCGAPSTPTPAGKPSPTQKFPFPGETGNSPSPAPNSASPSGLQWGSGCSRRRRRRLTARRRTSHFRVKTGAQPRPSRTRAVRAAVRVPAAMRQRSTLTAILSRRRSRTKARRPLRLLPAGIFCIA